MRRFVLALFVLGCGAPSGPPVDSHTGGGGHARASSPFLPDYGAGTIDVQRWEAHVAIAWGGRVYGSTGEDISTNVTMATLALALPRAPIAEEHVAVLGLGTG